LEFPGDAFSRQDSLRLTQVRAAGGVASGSMCAGEQLWLARRTIVDLERQAQQET